MRLLMVIHTGPFHDNTDSLVGIARASAAKGAQVTVFAMSEGVLNLAREDFAGLAGEGVKLIVCDKNRQELSAPGDVPGVHYGSQYDLAEHTADSDRVISFT